MKFTSMTMVILGLCGLHQNVIVGNFYQGIIFKFLWWNWEQKKFQVVEWSFKQGKKTSVLSFIAFFFEWNF